MFAIKSVWKVVKKDDRILIIMPNIKKYLTANLPIYLLKEFQKTLHSIFSENPSYVVAVFPSIESENDFLIYENFYEYEIQHIEDMSVFHNEIFKQYMKRDKLYTITVNDMEDFLYHLSNKYVDIVLFDDPLIDKEYMQIVKHNGVHCSHGRCYIDDFLNAKMYLKKVLNKLMKPLRGGMHQDIEDDDIDIALIIGNNSKVNDTFLKDTIYELIKRNQLSLLITTDNVIYNIVKDMTIELNIRLRLSKIVHPFTKTNIHDFYRLLRRAAVSYTSYVFIGEFTFDSKESQQIWDDKKDFLQGNSVFDVDAIRTLFPEEKDIENSKYRLSQNPLGMLDLFLDMNDDCIIDIKNTPEI